MENYEKPTDHEAPFPQPNPAMQEMKDRWETLTDTFATFVTMRMSELTGNLETLTTPEELSLAHSCLGAIDAAAQAVLKSRGIDPNQRVFFGTPYEIGEVLAFEGPRFQFRVVGEMRWSKQTFPTREDAFAAARKFAESCQHG